MSRPRRLLAGAQRLGPQVVRDFFLLDTGPLQEFFIHRYERDSNRQWPDRTFQFQALRTQLDRDDFEKFVWASRGNLGTSSGVIAEVNRFVQRAENLCEPGVQRDLRHHFWRVVRATFRDLRMEERTVPVIEIAEQALFDHGPVDAALFELAKRAMAGSRVVLLTADRRLRELCLQHEVPAEYVTERLTKFRMVMGR